MSPSGVWAIERVTGDPADLHAEPLLAPVTRRLRWSQPDQVALVLGRGQRLRSDPDVSTPVVRRVSGGGAVLVAPGLQAWADITIPADDPLWDDDVGRAAWWVGAAWVSALVHVGVPEAALTVHRGAMARTEWSDRVCFAGRADGEVLVDRSKIVGVAQRRTREGALFQCAALLEWDPVPLLRALGVRATELGSAAAELADVAVGLRRLVPGIDAALLESAFAAALPD